MAYLQLYNKGVLRLTLELLNELINNGILAARSLRQTKTKGIWFGTSYDTAKDEWFVWHYITP